MLSCFSHIQLFVTLWTVAHQALLSMEFSRQEYWSGLHKTPLSMGFSRQDYWSGLPCPPPGELPNPGIEPTSRMSAALAEGWFTSNATWEALFYLTYYLSIYHLF